MKIILTIISILTLNNFISQDTSCLHNVSTNYLNPTNGSAPSNPSLNNNQFLNHFNWNAVDNFNFLATYPLQNMQYNQDMINIQNSQQDPYYSYIYSGEKMSYENGWELLLLNIGKFPNLDPLPISDFTDIPYIVLYNRYKGILRLFANYGNGYLSTQASIDAMRIELHFDVNLNGDKVLNGLLRLNKGTDEALDQNTTVNQLSSMAFHPNQPNKWFSTDFQVAYDPCVCYYPSNMRFKFFAIENQDLELHGREIEIEQNLISGKALNQKDYLSNFDYSGDSAKGGMLMYKTLDYMINEYKSKLDAYKIKLAAVNEFNANIERESAIIDAFKYIVIEGGNAAISSASGAPWFIGLVNWAGDMIGQDSLKVDKLISNAKEKLSKGVNNLVSEKLTKQDDPTAPISPSASFSEMHFKGKVTDYTSLTGPNFFTPGTYGSNATGSPVLDNYSEYPIYNEALGVFALLESPKLLKSMSSTIKTTSCGVLPLNFRTEVINNRVQFKLKEPLKYTFNPVLNYVSKNIKAMYIVKAKNKFIVQTDSTNSLASFVLDNSVNLFSDSINKNDTLLNYTDPIINLNNQHKIKKESIAYNTGFLPLDAFTEFTIEIGSEEFANYNSTTCQLGTVNSANSLFRSIWEDFDVQVKLLIDVKYNESHENGKPHEYTYVFTYDVKDNNITLSNIELSPSLENSIGDIMQYNENTTFHNTNFNGGIVQGCVLTGTTYTCKSWNDATIEGLITTSNGYKVEIKAGHEIIMIPESSISPEINLSIVPVLNYSKPMPQVIQTQVTAFCNNNNSPTGYNANRPVKSFSNQIASEEAIREKSKNNLTANPFTFTLYPNPATSETTIQLKNANFGDAVVRMYDITGKEVFISISSPKEDIRVLNVSALERGVYFVKVDTYGETLTKQLIVQ